MDRSWTQSLLEAGRRVITPWGGIFLLVVQLAVIGLDLFSDSVDLTWEAYVAMLLFSLILGIFVFEQSGQQSHSSSAAPTGAPIGNGSSGKREGIVMQGGKGRFRNTSIQNQDVAFKAKNSDIDSDGLDVR